MADQDNNAVFTDEEQGRILFHLGYGLQTVASFLSFGVVALTQPGFLLTNALQHVPATRAMIVRDLLAKLDAIEAKIIEAQDYLIAAKLEQLELRENPTDLLENEHTRLAKRMADTLMCVVNPYSDRFRDATRQSMNVPIRRV